MRVNLIKYIAVLILLILIHLFFYNIEYTERVDYKFYDISSILFNQNGDKKSSTYSVVIDIDESSLQQLGQWPWPRVLDAQLIDSVYKLNPSAIGINILFSEQDRVSPIAIKDFYKNFYNINIGLKNLPSELKDNDKLLLDSIMKSGATLSTYFHNSTYTASHCQDLLYKNNIFSNIKTEFNAPALLCNYETIQNGVENFGFINAWEDSDGRLRRVPLFMEYRGNIFPSFALATLLSFDKYIKIDGSVNPILIDSSTRSPKVFSAIDILDGKVPKEEIQGKVVIIGSSVVGLNPIYITSNGKSISNSMINALVVDSILSNNILSQPEQYKMINIILSLLFSIAIMILFVQRQYLKIFILFLLAIIVSSLSLESGYLNNIYISIGYFWTPTLYLFMLFVLYYIVKIDREKQEQEKILIIQSKLASMGEMIALIAHQWRQPLSSINGVVINIDVDYRKNLLSSEQLDKHLNQIENTTAYLSKTINDFTDFFSKNKKSESFYIRDIIKQTEDLTVISSHKNIEIVYTESEEIMIEGYSSELIQSLLILLNNAIYACQKNLENVDHGKIMIHTFREKKSVVISIEDNGGGIDPKNIKRIFDPYFTTKNKENGTGLGLYILKLIVEDSMYGKVFVKNGENGAIFTIILPIKS
jgi:signal transduction histidine kinase